jgi:hypothetical protein
MSEASVRSRFVRVLVEAIQLQSGGLALGRLKQQLPTRLMRLLSRAVLSARQHDETIELGLAVDLLLAVDQALCGGSGQVLTRAAAALSSRVLANGPELVMPGETLRTLKCLRAPFEQPFVNARVEFEVERTPGGFVFSVALPGYPQALPLLRPFALGYAQSAVTFSGDHPRVLGLSAEIDAESVRVVGRISTSHPTLTRSSVPAGKPRPRASGRSRPSLAARVDQILQGQTANRQSPSGERNSVETRARDRRPASTGVVPTGPHSSAPRELSITQTLTPPVSGRADNGPVPSRPGLNSSVPPQDIPPSGSEPVPAAREPVRRGRRHIG